MSTAKKFGIPESVLDTELFNIEVWRSVLLWINTKMIDKHENNLVCELVWSLL